MIDIFPYILLFSRRRNGLGKISPNLTLREDSNQKPQALPRYMCGYTYTIRTGAFVSSKM
jgi:hypothetical protein